jgi:hypothetical protein
MSEQHEQHRRGEGRLQQNTSLAVTTPAGSNLSPSSAGVGGMLQDTMNAVQACQTCNWLFPTINTGFALLASHPLVSRQCWVISQVLRAPAAAAPICSTQVANACLHTHAYTHTCMHTFSNTQATLLLQTIH